MLALSSVCKFLLDAADLLFSSCLQQRIAVVILADDVLTDVNVRPDARVSSCLGNNVLGSSESLIFNAGSGPL